MAAMNCGIHGCQRQQVIAGEMMLKNKVVMLVRLCSVHRETWRMLKLAYS